MGDHDIWYFAVETVIDGERRGFSLSTRARPDRHGDIPAIVRERCETFLAEVVDGSDVHVYDAVANGDRCDWPYRSASYVVTCNGADVVRSFAVRPLKPTTLT